MLEPLQAIRDITRALSSAPIAHWLFGGWAIDFHLGVVTRHHDDIDMLIWSVDTPKLMAVLQNHTFTLTATMPEHLYFEKYNQRIEISFIERNHLGQIITPGRWAAWPWASDAFVAGERELYGVRCPVTSLQSVLETKREFQAHAANRLREKDRLDLARIAEVD